jgi:hypothetical protein
MTKKILFLIPDGVGIRNYLYSDVLKNIKQERKITFWSPLPKKAFEEIQLLHDIDIDFKNIIFNTESTLTRIFRESATFGRLISNSIKTNNSTILTNWNYNPKSLKLKVLNKITTVLGSWSAKKYNRILKLEKYAIKYWKRSVIENYKEKLVDLQPTSIFITHQRVASLMPICIAARELGIPIITAIYSWDNLPKARLAVQADKYMVWSDFMKEEMKTYYPEINQEDVLITGTPQFEFYYKKELLVSREYFANKYGLDITKKWICFSGDDKMTSPNDPQYLEDIATAITNDKNTNNIQIVFRRCPVDFSNRYDEVIKANENIIAIDPEWHTNDAGWSSFFPKFSDLSLLVNVAFHCDLVINVGSTMAHDFAILNKPCFYINYDKNSNTDWTTKTIYNFQHFRTIEDLDAVGWLNSSQEITNKIVKAIHNPDTVGKDKEKWLKKIVVHPLEENSKKIANVLLNKK